MDRRRFFREGLRELLRPVSKAVEPIQRVAKELGNLESTLSSPPPAPAPKPPPRQPTFREPTTNLLRPPGALPEQEFLSTCSRCAKCAEVCPAECIKLDPTGTRADGAPNIEPDAAACVLCTGLECMHNCPSGALVAIPVEQIDMGTAVWHEHLCIRTHGEPCTMCVDHCPVGPTALEILEGAVVVHEDGCTGCGVCQNNCPTDPKSITVTPRLLRDGPPGAIPRES
jgi:MauM/NapG family ferredoxin protein